LKAEETYTYFLNNNLDTNIINHEETVFTEKDPWGNFQKEVHQTRFFQSGKPGPLLTTRYKYTYWE
jgi:hypothetical protein